ncbi:hypothetical protein L218DRAFT_501853 [Marasmius fiardii PR-910]|nr:hypothetical protein L218DRAFT_501853 [Marasmius fiardii PR-910]
MGSFSTTSCCRCHHYQGQLKAFPLFVLPVRYRSLCCGCILFSLTVRPTYLSCSPKKQVGGDTRFALLEGTFSWNFFDFFFWVDFSYRHLMIFFFYIGSCAVLAVYLFAVVDGPGHCSSSSYISLFFFFSSFFFFFSPPSLSFGCCVLCVVSC